uniref:Uncharacterized protein n=1 Tax=Panagrellus redivivus TaxID=6233 RepID=A0A7E4V3Q1_PANRE
MLPCDNFDPSAPSHLDCHLTFAICNVSDTPRPDTTTTTTDASECNLMTSNMDTGHHYACRRTPTSQSPPPTLGMNVKLDFALKSSREPHPSLTP